MASRYVKEPEAQSTKKPGKVLSWLMNIQLPTLVYADDTLANAKLQKEKAKINEDLTRLREVLCDDQKVSAAIDKVQLDITNSDPKHGSSGDLKITHLYLGTENMLAVRFLGVDQAFLLKIQISTLVFYSVPICWIFGACSLFVDNPLCDIFVATFTVLSFITVGTRLMGIDTIVEFWLICQFHHLYKVLQGILFAVSFTYISKFHSMVAGFYGFSCFLWIWYICSIDAVMMPRDKKVYSSIIITAATLFLTFYVMLSKDVSEYIWTFSISKEHTVTMSMTTVCLNAALQIFLLSVYSIYTLIFLGESSINILVQAPLTHCIHAIVLREKENNAGLDTAWKTIDEDEVV